MSERRVPAGLGSGKSPLGGCRRLPSRCVLAWSGQRTWFNCTYLLMFPSTNVVILGVRAFNLGKWGDTAQSTAMSVGVHTVH